MAIVLQQVMPAGIPTQMVDEVTDEMGVDSDPPQGLVVHVHYQTEGEVHILDIWDSQADYDRFNAERLGPAMAKVAAAHGMDLSQAPPSAATTIHEVARVVRGS